GVFSSGDLVEATQRSLRKGRSIRPPRPPGEFPPGWDAWFVDAYAAARRPALAVEQLVSVLLAREPFYPTGYRRLGRLQAFVRLWRQDWREGPIVDRRTRRLSMGTSVLLHVLWLQLMILFMVGRFPSDEEEAERLGEDITQVEFIGEGTPQEEGGGAQQAELPEPAVAASEQSSAPSAPAAAPQPTPPPPPPPPAQVEVQPEQVQPPAPVAEQPLEVSEPVQPDPEFALVEPRIEALPTPALPTPE